MAWLLPVRLADHEGVDGAYMLLFYGSEEELRWEERMSLEERLELYEKAYSLRPEGIEVLYVPRGEYSSNSGLHRLVTSLRPQLILRRADVYAFKVLERLRMEEPWLIEDRWLTGRPGELLALAYRLARRRPASFIAWLTSKSAEVWLVEPLSPRELASLFIPDWLIPFL